MKIKKIHFDNYKIFNKFSVNLSDFDVLVGPNNSGKSTILGVFKILSEGIKKRILERQNLLKLMLVKLGDIDLSWRIFRFLWKMYSMIIMKIDPQ